MKTKSAFTIVELLVVVTIITILAAISVYAYNGAQKDSRDNTRKGNVTVITEALERYYEKNGEYPSVVSLVNNSSVSGQAVASKLGITLNDLKMPRLPSGVTNPLTSTVPPTSDNISYIASSTINDAKCKTDVNSGCDQFTLRYIAESGATVNIESRRKGRASSTPTTSEDPISVSLVVTQPNVVATASTTATCNPGTLTRKFAFSYRTIYGNDAMWSGWSDANSTWSTSSTLSITGVAGTQYEFKAYTRCDNGATAGPTSVPSAVATITYPVTPPDAPTVGLSYSSGDIFWTMSAVTCDADALAEYTWRWHNQTNTWNAWSGWGTGRTWKFTPWPGYTYYWEAKSRCHTVNVDSSESLGPQTTYTHPINSPAPPSLTVTPWDGSKIVWDWSDISCTPGTYPEYQAKWSRENFAGNWSGAFTTTTYSVNTTLQGYEYNLELQARCANTYTAGSWGASANSSTINPIYTPGAPNSFTGVLSGDRMRYDWSWTAPTCGAGTRAEYIYNIYWNTAWSGTWSSRGYWAPGVGLNYGGSGFPSGYKTGIRSQYTCVNTATGRESSVGPIGTSPINTIP